MFGQKPVSSCLEIIVISVCRIVVGIHILHILGHLVWGRMLAVATGAWAVHRDICVSASIRMSFVVVENQGPLKVQCLQGAASLWYSLWRLACCIGKCCGNAEIDRILNMTDEKGTQRIITFYENKRAIIFSRIWKAYYCRLSWDCRVPMSSFKGRSHTHSPQISQGTPKFNCRPTRQEGASGEGVEEGNGGLWGKALQDSCFLENKT